MLPTEMAYAILAFCDAPTLLNARLACRAFLSIIESRSFWSSARIAVADDGGGARAIDRLRAVLYDCRAGKLRAGVRREVKKLIKDAPSLPTHAFCVFAGGERSLEDGYVVMGDHIRLAMDDVRFDAIVVETGDEPRDATIIAMISRGALRRTTLGECTGLFQYHVVFNRDVPYKGTNGYGVRPPRGGPDTHSSLLRHDAQARTDEAAAVRAEHTFEKRERGSTQVFGGDSARWAFYCKTGALVRGQGPTDTA
jgi:hypothetical protein